MQDFPTVGKIYKECKLRHLLGKIGTNMYKLHHPVAKLRTNTSDATYCQKDDCQVKDSIHCRLGKESSRFNKEEDITATNNIRENRCKKGNGNDEEIGETSGTRDTTPS